SLEDLVEQMNRWRSRQNLGADLRELIGGQKGVGSETAELRSRIPASKPIQLPPQQRADLSRLAGRQRAEADRAAQFLRTLERTIEDLRESGPDAADAVRDVRDEFERLATESLMRQAASDIEENHLGEAAMRQQQTLERLAELDDLLHERGGPEGELLLKKLGEAESQLETLRKKQEELLKESQAAANEPDAERRAEELKRLAKEQQELRREVEGLARRLRRLESRPAAAAARRAGERLREAEERLEKDDDPQAAAHEQAEALDDLEQAQREIARQRQEEQERLAREMLERIADELKAILPRQQNVLDETLRLRKLKDEEGRLTRAQLITLSDLAAVERGLKDETDRLAQTVEAAEVFALALRGAARHIERAAVRLADKQLDDATLAAERAALARFQALVAALESEGEQNQQPQQDPQQRPRPNDQGGPQTDGIPHLAQLRMLKSLQEELLARTAQLDELHQDVDELSEDQQAELKSIAEEQQQLSDLARNLTRQVAATFETRDPEPAQAGPQE
ncbi:MAG: hypothetical protein KY476_26190, partial [Planctomycetes bacterium]|nr:hypothetical protein [Planctomycetota bacterium]